LKVTEEHVQIGYCEKCGKRHDGSFSEEFVNPVNYGDDIKAIISLLNTRMNLPINKISELLRILTDSKIKISDGTVVNIVNDFAQKSVPTVKRIVEHLTKCGLLLVDETGCRVNGKLDWFQIFTDDYFTLFSHNKKRGSLLFEGDDLLALFTGILLHDHFKSYYRYNHLTHAECNDHIDRRLKAVVEIFKHEWALKLRSFFFDTNKRKKELMDRGEYFSEQEIKDYYNKFLEILDMGDAEYQQAIEGKQRIVRFNEEKCLLKRLREYANEHLRYITVPEVYLHGNTSYYQKLIQFADDICQFPNKFSNDDIKKDIVSISNKIAHFGVLSSRRSLKLVLSRLKEKYSIGIAEDDIVNIELIIDKWLKICLNLSKCCFYNEFESQFIKLSDKLKDVAEFERYYRTDMCESRLEWDANVERIDARAVRKIVYKIIRYISPLIKNNNGSFI
jgi:hypothetical protein